MKRILILTSIIFSLTVANYSFGVANPRESFGIYNERNSIKKPVTVTKPTTKPVTVTKPVAKPIGPSSSGHLPSEHIGSHPMLQK